MTKGPIFPAVYRAADKLSAVSQGQYLWSLRAEYALLIVCGAMSGRSGQDSWYYYLFTFLFCLSLTFFIWRFLNKPEQVWYQGRALAESIKTSSWRFCMRAPPFDMEDHARATREFRKHLKNILDANQFAGTKLPAEFAADDQVTTEMCRVREKPLDRRMSLYEDARIKDQREWYARKAGANKASARRWVVAAMLGSGPIKGIPKAAQI
ncbi:DUF4231 domain-containing protein [Altericroceibacterium xinjiangense]|uniref:DUF4231 domain-containing protein n=1 Tax=Altericroceibacterium xinjiangense TaxID=762261 RepID=UPI000F7F7F9E|nr:DUF4231 domain-containing protein [Altericroceibacterium xinjiangense]